MESIKNSLGYFDCFTVDILGHSGGLAFLSKKENSARLLGSTRNFIDVKI